MNTVEYIKSQKLINEVCEERKKKEQFNKKEIK